jgi:hypothetical protein
MGVLLFVWESFKLWLNNIFVAPFTNLEILWILVPVYTGLILAELFQEKKGTSMGNAISNAVIVFWGGIDFLRITVNSLDETGVNFMVVGKIAISLFIIIYGIFIVIWGLEARSIIKHIARIRNVSYFIIIFAPIYYTSVVLSWKYIFGVFVFFFIFYVVFEVIDEFIPDSKSFLKDVAEASGRPVSPSNFIGNQQSSIKSNTPTSTNSFLYTGNTYKNDGFNNNTNLYGKNNFNDFKRGGF